MPLKIARRTFSDPYVCQKEWPEKCFVQAGDNGLVIGGEDGCYNTAFFEAFPNCNGVDTFLRGEGVTVEEAESKAFAQYTKASQCKHDKGWDRRGYTNGAAFCNGCGVFHSKHFDPTTICIVCDTPCNWTTDKEGNPYCKEHAHLIPQDMKSSLNLMIEEMENSRSKPDPA